MKEEQFETVEYEDLTEKEKKEVDELGKAQEEYFKMTGETPEQWEDPNGEEG